VTTSAKPRRIRWTVGPRSVGGHAYVHDVLGSPEIYPLAIPLVGALIVPLLFPERATVSFYEIAASVIPLFFIVLAIDARIFTLRRLPKLSAEPSHVERVRFLTGQIRQNFVFLMLAYLGGGEYTALHTVAIGRAAAGQTYGPVSALAAGFLGTAVVAMRRGGSA
jgi:hypothetical protein